MNTTMTLPVPTTNTAQTGTSRSALEQLITEHLDQAYTQARRTLGNAEDAQDALQEALVQILRSAPRYDRTRPFGPWLARHVQNACSRLRWRNRRRQLREQDVAREARPTNDDVGGVDREAVRQAVTELREQDRNVIELHYWADLSQAEAAEALGIRENALAVRLSRARERLRGILAKRGLVISPPTLTAALVPRDAWTAPTTLAQSISSLGVNGLPATTLPLGPMHELAYVLARNSYAAMMGVVSSLAIIGLLIGVHLFAPSTTPAAVAGDPPPTPPPVVVADQPILRLEVTPTVAHPDDAIEISWTLTNPGKTALLIDPETDVCVATRVIRDDGPPTDLDALTNAFDFPEQAPVYERVSVRPGETILLRYMVLPAAVQPADGKAWQLQTTWAAGGKDALVSKPITLRIDGKTPPHVTGERRHISYTLREKGGLAKKDGTYHAGAYGFKAGDVAQVTRNNQPVGRAVIMPRGYSLYAQGIDDYVPTEGDVFTKPKDDSSRMPTIPPPADAGSRVKDLRLELRLNQLVQSKDVAITGNVVLVQEGKEPRLFSADLGELQLHIQPIESPVPTIEYYIGRGKGHSEKELAKLRLSLEPGTTMILATFANHRNPKAQLIGDLGHVSMIGWHFEPGTYRLAVRYRLSVKQAAAGGMPQAWTGTLWSKPVEIRITP